VRDQLDDVAGGPFSAGELVGVSEVGLVGDPAAMARALEEHLGLRVWDGSVDRPGGLAFVGERARTLILAPPGRGWLPTGRPAEAFPVTATVTGAAAGACRIPGTPYRIVGAPA
jgi:non-ribosomal peptide synthetase component F